MIDVKRRRRRRRRRADVGEGHGPVIVFFKALNKI